MALTRIDVEGPEGPIDTQLAHPPRAAATGQLLLLCHGLPLSRDGGRFASRLLPELAERMAAESGWIVGVASLRGVGETGGTFSATGWREDLGQVVNLLVKDVGGVALAGFGVGGALALRAAADDERIRGVCSLATPADLAGWCGLAEVFAEACTRAGVVGTAPLMASAELVADVVSLDPLGAIAQIPPRRIMVVHGADDPIVPVADARQLVEAADGRAELRIIQGAGHWLRADPRMVATLLGWLDRQR